MGRLLGYSGQWATVWVMAEGNPSQSQLRWLIDRAYEVWPGDKLTEPEKELALLKAHPEMLPTKPGQTIRYNAESGVVIVEMEAATSALVYHCFPDDLLGSPRMWSYLEIPLRGDYRALNRRIPALKFPL